LLDSPPKPFKIMLVTGIIDESHQGRLAHLARAPH
jgi:hypothetical protein